MIGEIMGLGAYVDGDRIYWSSRTATGHHSLVSVRRPALCSVALLYAAGVARRGSAPTGLIAGCSHGPNSAAARE